MKYGFKFEEGQQYARALLRDIDVSAKDLCEVCRNIRHLPAELAQQFLEHASQGLVPIWFKRSNKRLGHRSELGSRKGRYPVKACKLALKVLKNAIANAASQGMEFPVVAYVSASKQRIYPRLAAKGRRMRSNYETAYMQIVLVPGTSAASVASKVQLKAQKEPAKPVETQQKARETPKEKADAIAKD